jgi:hypothetical protein
MIAHEEFARLGTPGYIDGLGAGMVIGLAPVLQFGPEWMKEKIGREVLNGGATHYNCIQCIGDILLSLTYDIRSQCF